MNTSLKRVNTLFFLICTWLLAASFQHKILYTQLVTDIPQSIHLLEIDPKQFQIVPYHANQKVMGKETVKQMAHKQQARAAINGGFFKSNGTPAGALKIQEWFTLPYRSRGTISWSPGKRAIIDQLSSKCTVEIESQLWNVDGYNRERSDKEIVIYTPLFNTTTLTPSSGLELIIDRNQLVEIREGGNSLIPPHGWVLSIGSQHNLTYWKNLKLGTATSFEITLLPQSTKNRMADWMSFPYVVGGAPVLIRNGKIVDDYSIEQTISSFLYQRHARTAIGLLANGNWLLVVVDGNQPKLSLGMTIPELAHFMWEAGCVEALNLDGGGSSTMVLDNQIMNSPFGDIDEDLGLKKSRSVSDAILILDQS